MDPLTAGLTFLSSLPDLIKLGRELIVFLNHVSGNDPQGYVKRVGEAFANLNKAQSHEERQNAAEQISKAISGMR